MASIIEDFAHYAISRKFEVYIGTLDGEEVVALYSVMRVLFDCRPYNADMAGQALCSLIQSVCGDFGLRRHQFPGAAEPMLVLTNCDLKRFLFMLPKTGHTNCMVAYRQRVVELFNKSGRLESLPSPPQPSPPPPPAPAKRINDDPSNLNVMWKDGPAIEIL